MSLLKTGRAGLAAALLLSACGGGGSSATTGGSTPPPVTPGPVTPPPVPTASTPRDTLLPYLTAASAFMALRSDDFTTVSLQGLNGSTLAAVINDGEWQNGQLSNARPSLVVYLQNQQWTFRSLRTDGNATAVETGLMETEPVCGLAFSDEIQAFTDYEEPRRSVLVYGTDTGNTGCATRNLKVLSLASRTIVPVGVVSSTNPRVDFRHVFRNSRGGLSGFLLQSGSTLNYFNGDATRSSVVASGLPLRALQAARGDGVLWMIWSNSNQTRSIYRVDSSGQVSAPIYSSDTLYYAGHADTTAMYLVSAAQNATEIIRVPFSGTSSVLATLPDNPTLQDEPTIVTGTDAHLLVNQASFSAPRTALLSKVDGRRTDIGAADRFLTWAATTVDGRLLFNETLGPGQGTTAPNAVIADRDGRITEQFVASAWLGTTRTAEDFTRADAPRTVRALRVSELPGDYSERGAQGGLLLAQDFTRNSSASIGRLDSTGFVGKVAKLDADLLSVSRISPESNNGSAGRNLLAVDLERLRLVTLTPPTMNIDAPLYGP